MITLEDLSNLCEDFGHEGPLALWGAMISEPWLTKDVMEYIFTLCAEEITQKEGEEELRGIMLMYLSKVIPYDIALVEFLPDEDGFEDEEGLKFPSVSFPTENGQVHPTIIFTYEDFRRLISGGPEHVATVNRFLYMNYRLLSQQGTVFINNDGSISFDLVTFLGMNRIVGETLLSLNVTPERYLQEAINGLDGSQKTYFLTVLLDTEESSRAPHYGPWGLN